MKVVKTLVGWVVIVILLSINFASTPPLLDSSSGWEPELGNGFSNAVAFIWLSILCTAGISLIIWIPLGYGVGSLVFAIFGRVFGWETETTPAAGGQQPKSQSEAPPTRDRQALVNYVKHARGKGLSDDQISSNLTHNGWIMEEINSALALLNKV